MKDIAQERKERREEDSINKTGRVITRSKVKKKKVFSNLCAHSMKGHQKACGY